MTFKIDRRTFLQALIAAGASFTLPAKAAKTQVDQVWAKAQSNPWFFEVNEHGTLIDEGVTEPETWGDIFDYLRNGDFKDPKSTIDKLERCYALTSYLDRQLYEEIERLEEELNVVPPESQKALAALQKKIDALKTLCDEYEEPWQNWIEYEGKEGLPKFKKLVDDWLSDPIDWMQAEWIPVRSGAQGAAFGFFEDQPCELLKELGVVIVDGEHPGSSYVAAELRANISDANAAAERLGLPFRFKPDNA